MTLTYGKTTPTSYTDPEVKQVNNCLFRLGAAVRPGTYLVDTFPILAYLPGYLSNLKRQHQEELALFREQVGTVKGKMVQVCKTSQTAFTSVEIFSGWGASSQFRKAPPPERYTLTRLQLGAHRAAGLNREFGSSMKGEKWTI